MVKEITERDTELDAYIAGLDLPEYAVPFEASPDYPMVRYAKKVTVVSGTKPTKYTGWHIGVDQSSELDNAMAMQDVSLVRVKHYGGNEEVYWQLDSIKGYVLCRSVPTEYGPDMWRKTGVAHVWNEHRAYYTYGSQLQCLFFMNGLLDQGYQQPLVLSFSHTVTEYFIQNVLRRQEAMLAALKKALRKRGKSDALSSYALWVELLKADEEITTKKGAQYAPPATMIVSPLTSEYVREHLANPAHLEVIEAFVPLWDAWAQAASARLLEPPRDNSVAPETEDSAPREAKISTMPPVSDLGIRVAKDASQADALRRSAAREKQRFLDAGFNTEEWEVLLQTLGIDEFRDRDDIPKVFNAIKKLMDDMKAS